MIKQGHIGIKMSEGETCLTNMGIETTPFPKIDCSTNRKTIKTLKRANKWLQENAVIAAKAVGDEMNLISFSGEDPENMPQASKDTMEEYLFGDVILKIIRCFRKT